MLFKVSPLDNVYFGSGMPFSAGFESIGKSIFPPSLSVFYGAFATYYLSLNGMNSQNIAFVKENLRVKGLYYKIGGAWYTLVPMDLVLGEDAKNKGENEVEFLQMCKPIVKTDLEDEQMDLLYSVDKVDNVKGLIDDEAMSYYLKGKKECITFIPFKDFVKAEDKIGIKIDDRKCSVKESYLYRINYIRMAKDVKNFLDFAVDVECRGFSFPDRGLIKLGGECRVANVSKINELPKFLDGTFVEEIKEIIKKTKMFKLILINPAIFKSGWKPDFSDLKTRVKLIAAAVGKPIRIGGWDLENKKPKVMSKAVPAGSVYYYKILDGPIDDLIEKVYNNGISDSRSNEGFGVSLLGGVL